MIESDDISLVNEVFECLLAYIAKNQVIDAEEGIEKSLQSLRCISLLSEALHSYHRRDPEDTEQDHDYEGRQRAIGE